MKELNTTSTPLNRVSSLAAKLALGSTILISVAANSLSAAVSPLDFDAGNGTSSFDQFEGVAGNGWASAWSVSANSASSGSTEGSTGVANDTPLYAGGGNYLKAGMSTPAGLSGTAQWAYWRQIDEASIDLSQQVSYDFYFRTDSAIADAGYQIFSRADSNAAVGTSASDTWEIFSDSDSWRVRNGAAQIDTGVTINAGEVYQFSITSDPTAQTWTVTIAGSGSNTYTSGVLSYRNTGTTSEGSFLEFAISDKNAANADEVYFSLDSVTVTQIPEPASAAMLFGVSGIALLFKRKVRI